MGPKKTTTHKPEEATKPAPTSKPKKTTLKPKKTTSKPKKTTTPKPKEATKPASTIKPKKTTLKPKKTTSKPKKITTPKPKCPALASFPVPLGRLPEDLHTIEDLKTLIDKELRRSNFA